MTEELQIEKKTTAEVTTNIRYNIIKTSLTTYSNLNFLGVDPKFADAAGSSFEIQTGSPALKKGFDLSSDTSYGSYLKADLINKSRSFPLR